MFPTRCTRRTCTVLTPEAHWWRARYTKLDAWNAWSSNQLKMFPTRSIDLHSGLTLETSCKCFLLTPCTTWSTMVKSKVHSAWRLKRLVKQPSWKCFLLVVLEQTWHSVNTWSTMVKSKVHSAWRLKRLVKQPSWRCFLLVVLNRLCIVVTPWSTMVKSKVHSAWRLKRLVKQPSWRCFLLVDRLGIVLTPEAQWWRARYTQLVAWNAWSSNQLENVSYSLY